MWCPRGRRPVAEEAAVELTSCHRRQAAVQPTATTTTPARSSSRADVVSVSDVRLEPTDETGTPSRLSINNSSGREALAILVKWHAPPT